MKFDITFIYSGGRTNKVNTISSSDFFYGFKEYTENGLSTTFIELRNKKTNIFDKLVVKITKLPLYILKSLSLKNYKVLVNSKNLNFINESTFISFLPLIFICKKFYNKNINYFPMGLVDKYTQGNFLSRIIINTCLKLADNILFIGEGELNAAHKSIGVFSDKYSYIPFSIDINHWNYKPKKNPKLKELLFIGNDQNRDFELLYSIAKKHKEYNFTIVSNNDNYEFSKLKNVKFLQGNLRDNILHDSEIQSLYHYADLVILPLKTSTQPSGQSVAIQSMSSGTPVMMTKTIGFWDSLHYIESKNILFVDSQNLIGWDIKLDQLSNNLDILTTISSEGRKLVEANHDLNNFIKMLSDYSVEIEL